MHAINLIAAILFAFAILHVLAAKSFERFADRYPRYTKLFHLLGEIEMVFGFWAFVLLAVITLVTDGKTALEHVKSLRFTESVFVGVIIVVAASLPVLEAVRRLVAWLAAKAPVRPDLAQVWLGFSLVPLLGSLITEPAAMTLAALMLAPHVFRQGMPEWLKYAALGVLFVNVSIGGTLTAYAAPPVLMVVSAWGWDTPFMAAQFGWKAVIAVLLNATAVTFMLRSHLPETGTAEAGGTGDRIPLGISIVHLSFLAGIVFFAEHPVVFVSLFLFFLAFTQAFPRYQSPLILAEGFLVGFFLAGLVVLGSFQQWWLQPIVSGLQPDALFFGALGITAITDNAALTYLGTLMQGMPDDAKYMLVAVAVAGGGLTVIANAPNPAGTALLKRGFNDESIGVGGLLLGALLPTAVAALAFYL